MPFKKDTASTLHLTQDITTNKQAPLSQEGLNASNLGGFILSVDPTQPGITPQERDRRLEEQQRRLTQTNTSLIETQRNTQQTFIQQQQHGRVETYGLVMPSVEYVPKPDNELTSLDNNLALLVITKIWDCIVYNKLYYFYTIQTDDEKAGKCEQKTPQQRLQDVANRASMHDYQILMELYKIPTVDQATDIAVLALFDIIELIDDSMSMKFTGYKDFVGNPNRTDFDAEEIDTATGIDHNTKSRWQLAEQLVRLTSYTLTMFDDDGISVRFLNKDHRLLPKVGKVSMCDNVTIPENITKLFQTFEPCGGTSIGASIKKIYEELVQGKLQSGTLTKPVLLLTYTDGESVDQITPVIRDIRHAFRNTKYGSRGMLFSFNQVGRDAAARKMLGNLDNDEVVGDPDAGAGPITDCTSAYKDEKDEYDRTQAKLLPESRIPYTPAFHTIKGMVGPAIEKYDKSDEDCAPVGQVNKNTGMFSLFR
jgi:hypothetical protein